MSPELIAAAVRLADVLRAENDALARLDLPAASGLLDGKQAAAAAFARLVGAAASPGRPASGEAREVATGLREVAAGLRELAQDNRRLLERAMLVQNRVIGTVTRAAAASAARAAPRYGRGGAMAPGRGGCALVAQA